MDVKFSSTNLHGLGFINMLLGRLLNKVYKINISQKLRSKICVDIFILQVNRTLKIMVRMDIKYTMVKIKKCTMVNLCWLGQFQKVAWKVIIGCNKF